MLLFLLHLSKYLPRFRFCPQDLSSIKFTLFQPAGNNQPSLEPSCILQLTHGTITSLLIICVHCQIMSFSRENSHSFLYSSPPFTFMPFHCLPPQSTQSHALHGLTWCSRKLFPTFPTCLPFSQSRPLMATILSLYTQCLVHCGNAINVCKLKE